MNYDKNIINLKKWLQNKKSSKVPTLLLNPVINLYKFIQKKYKFITSYTIQLILLTIIVQSL